MNLQATGFALIGLFTAAIAIDTPQANAAGKRRLQSFNEVAKYLLDQSNSAIQVNTATAQVCKDKKSPCANFERKPKLEGHYWDSEKSTEDTLMQTLFSTDEDRFIRNQGGTTFSDAKERAYSQMKFNKGKTAYELPFENLRGWGSLIHPPIFNLTKPLDYYLPGMEPVDFTQAQHPYLTEAFQRKMDLVSQTELTAGNVVSYLGGGPISFQAKLNMVKNAKKSMWVQVMVFACDPLNLQIYDAMAERKRAGVDVRLMIEGLYARIAFRKCVKKWKRNEIDLVLVDESTRISRYNTFAKVAHPKVWIRDGEEAIVGGINMLESELVGDGFVDGNRDSDILIQSGPLVTDLMEQYTEIWQQNDRKRNQPIDAYVTEVAERLASERARGVRGEAVYQNYLNDPVKRSTGLCRASTQRNGITTQPIAPVLALYASEVQKRVVTTTPKIKMNKKFKMKVKSLDALWVELQKAVNERGARVDLITNGPDGAAGDLTRPFRKLGDVGRDKDWEALEDGAYALANALTIISGKGNHKHLKRMQALGKGFHGWQYLRYGHQKVQIFDRLVTSIGSFNWDGHSALGNQETQVFCIDQGLASQTEYAITRDIVNGTPTPGNATN